MATLKLRESWHDTGLPFAQGTNVFGAEARLTQDRDPQFSSSAETSTGPFAEDYHQFCRSPIVRRESRPYRSDKRSSTMSATKPNTNTSIPFIVSLLLGRPSFQFRPRRRFPSHLDDR
jgi:hypothetical protein